MGVVVVIAAGGYAYLQYTWSHVKTDHCSNCVAITAGKPYNVLVIGSDSRVGDTQAQSQSFGSASVESGQRSDTIKIVHVDPGTRQARILSIPRDTFVQISGVPASSGLGPNQKINASFNNGPKGLVDTIEATFGIPINDFIIINFNGLQGAVGSLGGVSMDFPYPARDWDCETGACNNQSGLVVQKSGCQVLNGPEALALSRSRHYEYYQSGEWNSDPLSDLGRIERQNLLIQAIIDKGKSTYNPIKALSFIHTVAGDVTRSDGLTFSMLFDLVERYHAFSGSRLATYTIPTVDARDTSAGDALIVDGPQAQAMITQFLGSNPLPVTTPPLDANGSPQVITAPTTIPSTPVKPGSSATGPQSAPIATTPASSFDPIPC